MQRYHRRPHKPEAIEIKTDDGLVLTAEQQAAVEGLRQQVFEHGQSMGVRYHTLYVTDDTEEIQAFDAGLHPWNKYEVIFKANITTLLAAIKDGIDLEESIKHENAHVQLKHALFSKKLHL